MEEAIYQGLIKHQEVDSTPWQQCQILKAVFHADHKIIGEQCSSSKEWEIYVSKLTFIFFKRSFFPFSVAQKNKKNKKIERKSFIFFTSVVLPMRM